MGRSKYTIEEAATALRQTGGIVAQAAERLGVTRRGLWARIERNEKLQRVHQDCREHTLDVAESMLFEAIRNGEGWACQFYLKHRGHSRGYTTRVEQTGAGGGPIEYLSSVRNADAELRKWEAELDKGTNGHAMPVMAGAN